jgi:predicted enzyme related to lactoylglutathione lyase
MMSRMRVFRIAIPTDRLDQSRTFYERVLGMTADDTVPTRLYFHCGDVILALIDWTVEERRAFNALPDYVYLATDELDDVYTRAVDAGASITSPIEQRGWGERSFYCLDLDGNKLCFVDDTTLFLGRGADWS